MTRPDTKTAVTGRTRRAILWLVQALAFAALAGCAGFNTNPRDPLEPMNRNIAQFNEGVDAMALKLRGAGLSESVAASGSNT